MAPAKSIEKEKLYCEIFNHGVTGLGAWKEMADGMLSAVSGVFFFFSSWNNFDVTFRWYAFRYVMHFLTRL